MAEASDGWSADILRRRLAVDGGAEYVEHPRHYFLTDRHLERLA
jgi:hypothetical protein